MRYAVISEGLTISQLQNEVKRCGGKNLRVAAATKQVFCDLEPIAIDKLKAAGCIVSKVGGVKAAIMPPVIAPPVPVAAIPTYSPEELVWATGLEDLRFLTEPPLYGEGFNIAIIDTGILETHQRINGRVIYSKNYTSDPMRDGLNHGTGVASIVTTVAPLCNILNLKVLNDRGEGTEEELTLAIDDCLAMYDAREEITPLVMNLSLGTPDNGNPNSPMRVACRAAIERGIWVAAAAGNDGPKPSTILSPACEKYVFAVGSAKYDTPFTVSDFSGRGPTKEGLVKPEALMFGENIVLASSESNTATIAKTGTSFATPFMSASALLYHEGWLKVKYVGEPFPTMWTVAGEGRFPELEVLEAPPNIDIIIDRYLGQISAKPQGVPLGKDNAYGYGIIAGGLIATALGIRPAVDISTMMSSLVPILGIGMLGMVMGSMAKAFR